MHEETTHTRRAMVAGGAAGLGALLAPAGAAAQPLPIDDRYVLRERSPINVKDYGAVGSGSTSDDTDEIEAAIAALPANGGTLFFPRGRYRCSRPLNFDGKRSVVLAGEGGLSGGATPASQIVYIGSGARFVSARSTAGFTIRDLSVSYESGFSGTLIDLSALSGGLDTQLTRIENSLVGSGGPSVRTALLVDLARTISSSFDNVLFSGGETAVRGKTSVPVYSNVIGFRACEFVNIENVPVRNPGQAWSFDGCTFEGRPGGDAGACACGDISANSLTFTGCWFGDATAAGTWIGFRGAGLSVRGCYVAHGAVGVQVGPNTIGVEISGNSFGPLGKGVEFIGENNRDVVVLANQWNGVTSPIVYGAPLLNGIVQCDGNGNHFNELLRALRMAGGAPIDGYWQSAPPNGTFYLDTANHRLYVRDGGTWRYVTLT